MAAGGVAGHSPKGVSMQECMNCGGPVADDDTHCTTCGLARGLVIYGERPSDDDD